MNIIGRWEPTHTKHFVDDDFVMTSKEDLEKLGVMEDYQSVFNSIFEIRDDFTYKMLVKISAEDLKELQASDEADQYEIVDGMVVAESGQWKQDGDAYFICGVGETDEGESIDTPLEVTDDYVEYFVSRYKRIS